MHAALPYATILANSTRQGYVYASLPTLLDILKLAGRLL